MQEHMNVEKGFARRNLDVFFALDAKRRLIVAGGLFACVAVIGLAIAKLTTFALDIRSAKQIVAELDAEGCSAMSEKRLERAAVGGPRASSAVLAVMFQCRVSTDVYEQVVRHAFYENGTSNDVMALEYVLLVWEDLSATSISNRLYLKEILEDIGEHSLAKSLEREVATIRRLQEQANENLLVTILKPESIIDLIPASRLLKGGKAVRAAQRINRARSLLKSMRPAFGGAARKQNIRQKRWEAVQAYEACKANNKDGCRDVLMESLEVE